jgi:hypothetical protein
MGYSARYHAVSLAAIFLALAVGILIGAGFGNDVVSRETQNLEDSLKSNVVEARDRADALQSQLDREREFSQRAYPALVAGLLYGERVAIVAVGSLPDETRNDVEAALGPAGAQLGEVATVREPPDLQVLAGEAQGTRFSGLANDGDQLERFAARYGRALLSGGPVFQAFRSTVLSSFSGRAAGIDAVVVVRQQPGDLGSREQDSTERLEAGLMSGLRDTGVPVVGVELSDSDPSSIPFFESADFSSVDSVDLTSGRVALAYALAGAQGSFGIKDTADRLLPELLGPSGGATGP